MDKLVLSRVRPVAFMQSIRVGAADLQNKFKDEDFTDELKERLVKLDSDLWQLLEDLEQKKGEWYDRS